MEIHTPKDCDNAPKKRIIRDFIIAYSCKNTGQVNDFLAGDFSFVLVGEKEITEKEALSAHINGIEAGTKLFFEQILTHGKFGAANGRLVSSRDTDFAYFFEFTSAGSSIIKKITDYLVRIGSL